MFTGIVEEIGTVTQIRHGPHSAILTIAAETVLETTKIGDSIAVNGICLTVTALSDTSFSADVMHETLNRSALSRLGTGSHVNLERAMPADGRFGGHIVAGHVDGVGTVANVAGRYGSLVHRAGGAEYSALYRGERLCGDRRD